MVLNSYKYLVIKLIMTLLVFFVASNSVSSHFGFDFLNKIDTLVKFKFSSAIYFIAGFSIILLALNKYTWLPFLGESVLPSSLLHETKNTGDTSIKIKIKPNNKVAYWSSLPSTDKNIKVEQAYGAYSNAGVTVSDKNGFAVLTFNKGTGYIVPSGKYIKPHVHYRELNEFGMMGPVKTRYI